MIDILLSTYNGDKYLSQQLDSIINQTYHDWRILIRDDGSSDKTKLVIADYRSRYVDKIIVIEDNKGNLGSSKSFELLIKNSMSDYFMLCDQDDVWEPNKIEVSLFEMNKLETTYPEMPVLVCSDACCIDGDNQVLYASFFVNQKFIDTTKEVHKCLALNVVQGSTTLMNRHVKDVILSIPMGLYHDWWIAVNVAYYGYISYIHQPLLRYRQHQSNVVGALNVGPRYLLQKLSNVKKQMGIYRIMYKSLKFKPSVIKWAYYKFIINIHRF